MAKLPTPLTVDATPWRALIPAFLVGELRRAFQMGFLLYLPFLVIDVVVSSVLMRLGTMMLPPTAVALPFKLVFFLLVDGWRLVSGGLVPPHKPGRRVGRRRLGPGADGAALEPGAGTC